MPGRYLLIEFDDEDAATALRAQISNATSKGKKFRVVGLFARPGKACTCSYAADKTTRSKDWVSRGERLGWWVCNTCKRPRMGDHQLKNLIIPSEVIDPPTFVGVDPLYPIDVADPVYLRHPTSLTLTTYPERVAN